MDGLRISGVIQSLYTNSVIGGELHSFHLHLFPQSLRSWSLSDALDTEENIEATDDQKSDEVNKKSDSSGLFIDLVDLVVVGIVKVVFHVLVLASDVASVGLSLAGEAKNCQKCQDCHFS